MDSLRSVVECFLLSLTNCFGLLCQQGFRQVSSGDLSSIPGLLTPAFLRYRFGGPVGSRDLRSVRLSGLVVVAWRVRDGLVLAL
jgi:hypothetical protein